MTTIALHPQLAKQLNVEAKRQQTSVEALVNDWLEENLRERRVKKIQEESKRFQAKHAELYAQYAGQHIAMQEGVVLDHDADLLNLYDRVRARYGDEPVLITPVTAEPIQTFRVLSPRRQRVQP
jgi:hypothetical protein